jgi:P pilus assembly chaperone PapD
MSTPLRSLFALVALGCSLVFPSSALAFVGVDRGEVLLELVPGKGASASVTVTNSGETKSSVSLSVDDFAIEGGRPNFNSEPHARALARRLSVFPTSFDLAPGESKEVRVLLDPGAEASASGTHWAVIFMQTSRLADMVPPGGDRQVQVKLVERVGVFVFADAQPEPKPLPDDVAVTSLVRDGEVMKLSVRNPSQYLRMVRDGYVLVTPLQGGAAQRWPLQVFRLLPNSTVQAEIAVPATAAGLGKCNVLVALDYGSADLVAGEQEFTF